MLRHVLTTLPPLSLFFFYLRQVVERNVVLWHCHHVLQDSTLNLGIPMLKKQITVNFFHYVNYTEQHISML